MVILKKFLFKFTFTGLKLNFGNMLRRKRLEASIIFIETNFYLIKMSGIEIYPNLNVLEFLRKKNEISQIALGMETTVVTILKKLGRKNLIFVQNETFAET